LTVAITYEWRGEFVNTAVSALHAEGFGHDRPGGAHAFIIGTGLIAAAAARARAAGCDWLHVDFEDRLSAFYFEVCGFRPTMAGLIGDADPSSADGAADPSPAG
jgi:hypothetical protein